MNLSNPRVASMRPWMKHFCAHRSGVHWAGERRRHRRVDHGQVRRAHRLVALVLLEHLEHRRLNGSRNTIVPHRYHVRRRPVGCLHRETTLGYLGFRVPACWVE